MLSVRFLIVLLTTVWLPVIYGQSRPPRNVIILIGDGMGQEHLDAASIYRHGATGRLAMEQLRFQGDMSTDSESRPVPTDSAASATAMSSGIAVANGVISVAVPGDGSPVETLLEFYQSRCKSTGLVTTTEVTHATPAAFAAHVSSRNELTEIADDYLLETRPNVLLGGGSLALPAQLAAAAGYTVVNSRNELAGAVNASQGNPTSLVIGLFGQSHMPFEYDYATGSSNEYDSLPHLSEMAMSAISILSQDPDGFFLVIEGGRIDTAGHSNELDRVIYETLEFDDTVNAVSQWAQNQSRTLVIVTADHETGGLRVAGNNGAGQLPDVTWYTTGHTPDNVPVFARGLYADLVRSNMSNLDINAIAKTGSYALPANCAAPPLPPTFSQAGLLQLRQSGMISANRTIESRLPFVSTIQGEVEQPFGTGAVLAALLGIAVTVTLVWARRRPMDVADSNA